MAEQPTRKKFQATSITTVISISLVLIVVGMLGLFLMSAKKISDHFKESIGFHLYLKDHVKDEEVERLHTFLDAGKFVKSSRYVSKDEAAENYKKDVGEDFVKFIGYNPLPASIEVQLKAGYANADSIAWIKKQILAHRIVSEFDYQESLIDIVNEKSLTFSENLNKITLAFLLVIGILLLIAVVLINNTIRLAIYSKRFLIKTMQLVGATGGFIRVPFLLSGVKHGIIAGIVANLILASILYALSKRIPDLMKVADAKLMLGTGLFVLLLGIAISGISTFFAVKKYLRTSSDELYY